MGLYNTHGMAKDNEILLEAIGDLGMLPAELVVLADNARSEIWVYQQMAKSAKGQKKRRYNLMAGMWQRRYQKFMELAALWDQELDEANGKETFNGSPTA